MRTLPADVDPALKAHAEQQHDMIRARAGVELDALRDYGAPALMAYNPLPSQDPYRAQYLKLRMLVDEAARLVAPNTPCKKGCSACCYQAVPLSRNEARLIEAASGRRYHRNIRRFIPAQETRETIEHFNANAEARLHDPTPCPFLVDDACSIYEARPIPCRSHHVLHPDASRCKLEGKAIPQVKYDIGWTDELHAELSMHDEWADIREWFASNDA